MMQKIIRKITKDKPIVAFRTNNISYINKNQITHTFKDIYEDFINEYGDVVNYEDFVAIVKDFNKNLLDEIQYKNFKYTIPYSLGVVYLKKIPYRPRNYNKNAKLDRDDRYVYYLNWERANSHYSICKFNLKINTKRYQKTHSA